MWVPFLGQEDPLEEGMATHSSILAWKIPWTEEFGAHAHSSMMLFKVLLTTDITLCLPDTYNVFTGAKTFFCCCLITKS